MAGNWQTPEWPHFEWNSSRLARLEEQLRLGAGVAIGAAKHLGQEDYHRLQVEGLGRPFSLGLQKLLNVAVDPC
jgi:hypothetical protein